MKSPREPNCRANDASRGCKFGTGSPTCGSVMELSDFHYVTAVVESGSFARAADLIGFHASTISRRVARLEDELGLTLFERNRSGVRLTTSGQTVIRHIRRALAEIDAVKSAGQKNGLGTIGEIRLGMRLPAVGKPFGDLLRSWHERYPGVSVLQYEMHEKEIAAALADRRLDVAFVPSFGLWPHVATLPIFNERIVAALPPQHPLAKRKTLRWKELSGETILVQGWGDSQAQREFFGSLLGRQVEFQSHAACRESILAFVAAGFGLTLTTQSQAEIVFPDVVFRPISEANAYFSVGLVWLPECEDPVAGRFVAFMRDEAKERGLLE